MDVDGWMVVPWLLGGSPYDIYFLYIYFFVCCLGNREWMILNWCCVLGGWRDECYVLTYVVSDMDIHYTHIDRGRGRGLGGVGVRKELGWETVGPGWNDGFSSTLATTVWAAL